jgi:predicted NAD/FAD-binding protein
LVTAHLLDGFHEVVVFEKAPILGGHVRTLNRNVSCDLEGDLILDAGVLEFEPTRFPNLLRLFDSLGCEKRSVPGRSTFWTHDGHHHLSPGAREQAEESLIHRISHLIDLIPIRLRSAHIDHRAEVVEPDLDNLMLGDLLADADADRWAALLATYAYSIPYERVRAMPAALTVPVLRAFANATGWVSLRGGAWDYLGRIVDRFTGTIRTNTTVQRVVREGGGVTVEVASERLQFDKIVFAAPPDQMLGLLAQPTDAEKRRFGAWRGNHIHTLVHHDPGVYSRRGTRVMTEFDVIELAPNRGGYNCHLNEICGTPLTDARHFGLAYGIDEMIDADKVLFRQEHHTPDYTVEAYRWRGEVSKTNGENDTFHAGAWLGDGLQEGAINSALAISQRLGGHTLS